MLRSFVRLSILVTLLFISHYRSFGQTCNNWLNLPSRNSIVSVGDLDVPGNTVTVEAVFMRTAPYSGGDVWAGDLVSKHNNPPDINYLLRPNSAEITTSDNGYVRTPPVCEIELNKMYHVAMVYDGTRLKFYRNGFLMSSAPASGNLYQNNFKTKIGLYDALVHNTQLIGYINEVRIWNVARTQEQIRSYMNTSLPNPTTQTGLLAYYTFDNLLNKQGNATWNGVLDGAASINTQIPDCRFDVDSCAIKIPVPADSLIVNTYTPVLGFGDCNNSLRVKDATGFKAGDTVLTIQMKGVQIVTANTAQFGFFTTIGNSGRFEYNIVHSVNGEMVRLMYKPATTFTIPAGRVQLVRVPYFQDLVTDKVLTCLPWDGEKGGVLAFNVRNTLTLNNDIDVSGRGFRGGAAIPSTNGLCGFNDFVTNVVDGSRGGLKGESSHDNLAPWAGKNNPFTGGGGGNSINAGGGGGGNGGSGGNGGYEYDGCSAIVSNGGLGGTNVGGSFSINRIYMGGGGGAGHQMGATAASGGGNGGGIVIISAPSVISNGFSIKSHGETPAPTATPTPVGRSGGGAGGTILLDVLNYTGNVAVSAKGGDGGSNPGPGNVGPGGGGSAGMIWVSQGVMPAAGVSFNVTPGQRGINTLSGGTRNATSGGLGVLGTGLILPFATLPAEINIESLNIVSTPISCMSFDFKGSAVVRNYPIVSWEWSFGDGTIASTQDVSHTYLQTGSKDVKLKVTDSQGCTDSFTIQVKPIGLKIDFSYKKDICDPFNVQFFGAGSSGNQYWSVNGTEITGTFNPVFQFTAEGDFPVRYAVTDGVCSDTISKVMSIKTVIENIILTPDTTICASSTKLLRTLPALQHCWSTGQFLDNPALAQPTTSALQDITYYFTAEMMGANMILNGDFVQGNTGFSTDLTNASQNSAQGQYHVAANVSSWNNTLSNCTDHTSGSGNMLLINGTAQTDAIVWRQVVPVIPGHEYAFSAWLQSLSSQNPGNLRFRINGIEMSEPLIGNTAVCQWQQFYITWNSGTAVTAELAIIDKGTAGANNWFALDDISFAPVSIQRDLVKIMVDQPHIKAVADTSVCAGKPVQLKASGAQSYEWLPASALDDPSSMTPISSPLVTTQYIVTGTTVNGCVAKDTVIISIFAKPAIARQGDTVICKNTAIQLWVTGGAVYNWFPSAELSDPAIANPVATPSEGTKYHVLITDLNNCVYEDSVKVSLHPDPAFTVTGPGKICMQDSVTLTATGGDTFSWSPAAGVNDPLSGSPRVSPTVSTNYTVTITENTCGQSAVLQTMITVAPRPNVTASSSNNIDCSYGESRLSGSGALTYSWTPSIGLNNPRLANPIATPTASTVYVLSGTDRNGCEGRDSVLVSVTTGNKGGYHMPGAFTPNNDGLNDCYGIKFWGIVDEIEFSIFNRWGTRVFYSKDRHACWDGTYKGEKQPADAYVYMIRANTGCEARIFRKGTFMLIR
ncbi:gliding motility-associated C-terminal domain-containing protein [Terrimonas sp. NA20]|uniref:Gliding motility-associated C-terminal domain-containing protein n=1 Tax=Terrimonas ginsenosidimutans TaxID=2908004 RepID=A0ABS9KSV2_9BACT|nr:gliding motility-associated C-terminal domain-containing protein [Terrimonas ginsenosidimutans]MCG2615404.1 gliding motility-associated C-terminal domain-containing protein [Terrimonas ginsenosidimutans]